MFGTTQTGDIVNAISLAGYGMSATILTYGAIVQDVRLDGVDYGLTLGSDKIADYEGDMAFHGSLVGPVANRLRNAKAVIDGVPHQFEVNFMDRHTLHSASGGVHSKIWHIEEYSEKFVILSVVLPNGEAGFPGERHMSARFEIVPGPALRLTVTTRTDAPSLVNVANHSYWNLDGTDHMRDHTVRVVADQYLPSDAATDLPTGQVVDVDGTDFDLRRDTPLNAGHPPLDHTFCVAQDRRDLTDCMTLRGGSGVSMTVATTEAGLHLYDARAAHRPNGPFYEGIAIEAQGWPDAPNLTGFPSIEVTPDAPVTQVTQWRFSKP